MSDPLGKVLAKPLHDKYGTWWVLYREGRLRAPLALLDDVEMAQLVKSVQEARP